MDLRHRFWFANSDIIWFRNLFSGTSGISYCYDRILSDHNLRDIWRADFAKRIHVMQWSKHVKIPTAAYYTKNSGWFFEAIRSSNSIFMFFRSDQFPTFVGPDALHKYEEYLEDREDELERDSEVSMYRFYYANNKASPLKLVLKVFSCVRKTNIKAFFHFWLLISEANKDSRYNTIAKWEPNFWKLYA